MSQDYKEKEEKKNGHMMKISLVSLLIVLLAVIEMYEIINDPANMIVIGALGAFLLVSVYVEMLFIGKLIEKRAKEQEEAFDNVYRSEKASYLLMRKYFDQMDQKMENLGDVSNIPYKELIAAQKALAKAQINRNKQNTNALLISNDRMMQRLTSMQNDLDDILANTNKDEKAEFSLNETQPGFSEQDRTIILQGNKDVLEKQQEILHNMKEMESSLRKEIIESVNKAASIKSEQISIPQSQMEINEFNDDISPLDIDDDISILQPEMELNGLEDNISPLDVDKDIFVSQPDMELKGSEDIVSPLDIDENDSVLQPEMELNESDGFMSSLDINNEFSFDTDKKFQQSIQNSSESNLDRLLQQMNDAQSSPSNLQSIDDEQALAPIFEESELQPIEAEQELQPIESEFELQPIEAEQELQPIGSEPELQPIEAEQELQPIESESELQPIEAEQELQPIGSGPELQPIEAERELQPIEAEQELQPIGSEPELQPIEAEQELQPIESELELQPIEAEQKLQPIERESELQPIESEQELQPIEREPKFQPIEAEQESQPIERELELQPIESEIELPSITEEPLLQSKIGESELQSMTHETVLSSTESKPDISSADTNGFGNEITPDKLAAMVANLGTNINIEPDSEKTSVETAKSPFMAETLDPDIQKAVQQPSLQKSSSESTDEELEQIMKEMNIDNIPGDSLEDLDIDKILEIPLENDKSTSNQVMSSEEIAALIANTELLSDPAPAKNDDMMDLSDPSHVMSSDEIAALIANM